ncbi:GumC family protein [Flaviaesturariibacter aridisoli]|uniref:Capsular biosynthesis protein n=1 Tax=Flaviaesturariibacter aridisoli TaxID=2545761 RepID=A0A4R4DWX4_9BACT|nr:GNVR domain-containing protein [Flaviaesturariibacter aridisoli]TCZ69063.1 capsular biosynthesis protein [Flaviaesturariibacter aridisoli]
MLNRPKTKNTSFAEGLSFRYLPYWPLFVFLAILFGLGALAYLRYATPLYEANATLLIKDEKKGSEELTVSESLNLLSSKKIVENEVVVLQSRNLLDEVVRSLHLYAPIYEKGAISDRSAYTTSPILVSAPDPARLTETPAIAFEYDSRAQTVLLEGKTYPLHQPVVTPYGVLQFSLNPHFRKMAGHPLFFRLDDPRNITAGLAKRLEVTAAGKLSSIVRLKLKDEVPERGEDILNTLIRDYNESSIDYKNTIARNTIAFVDDRMRIVQRELSSVEQQIQTYKSRNNVVDLSEQGKLYLKNVGENDQRLAEINMKLAVLEQVERYVSSKEGNSIVAPSTLGVEDPLLSGLLQKLYETELERDRLRKTTGDNHPSMLALDEQLASMRPSILENINSQRRGLQASQRDLSSTNSTYNNMLQSIPQKERELLDVSRQQSIKNSIYSFLLQKREETAIASASNIPDSKVVETARATLLPVSPNKPFILGAALLLALMTGIGYVTLRESASQKILFRQELETLSGLPVLGELTQGDSHATAPQPAIGEQLRQLRVAAGLFGKNAGKKKILVTSSMKGEGKTFLAEHLAWNLSLSGKKVVLLKSDLRGFRTGLFTQEGSAGLADFLENEKEPYEIIKGTEYPNLFVVQAGTTETQATELLLNGKLANLFDYLEETFDFIVLDAAPVGSATDAYILAEWSDLTLYVVRHAWTPKSLIRKLDETHPVKALGNLFVVFNGVRPRGFLGASPGLGYGSSQHRSSTSSQNAFSVLFQQLQSTFRKPLLKKRRPQIGKA